MVTQKRKDAQSGVPGVFDKMPEKLTQMQHLLSKDVLSMRVEAGQIVPKWLARHALAVPNLPHRNPRSYDGCEE
jgi:hypothetical protein